MLPAWAREAGSGRGYKEGEAVCRYTLPNSIHHTNSSHEWLVELLQLHSGGPVGHGGVVSSLQSRAQLSLCEG